MITAKDIHRKKFEQVKFGYNPEEVEAFLGEIEQDFRLMEQQLSDSNDKVQLLADKVRDYKETEEDLRNALVGAQKQAREVIEAAKQRAAQIEAEARSRGDSVKAEAIVGQEEQLQELEGRIKAKQQELDDLTSQTKIFKQFLLNAYKAHLKLIAQMPTDSAPAEKAEPEQKKAAEKPAAPAEVKEPVKPEAPAEPAKPEKAPEKKEEPEKKASEPKADAPAEQPAAPHSSAIVNDPFAAEDAEKLRQNEIQFGSRRDDKRRRR